MRKIMIILPAAFLALLLLPFMYTPAQSNSPAIILPTPTVPTITPSSPVSVAPSMPACIEEDGAGMALCWWDASEQGNGVGTSVISGDCAPEYVGGQSISDMCVSLYARRSYTITHADGSKNTIPNGADLVRECTEEWNMMDDAEAKEQGFTLEECFKAWM